MLFFALIEKPTAVQKMTIAELMRMEKKMKKIRESKVELRGYGFVAVGFLSCIRSSF